MSSKPKSRSKSKRKNSQSVPVFEDEEKIDQIIEMHRETVDALREERDSAKERADKLSEDAKKLSEVQEELKTLKEKENTPDPYKKKYEDVKAEYDSYKHEQESKIAKEQKEKLYRKLLKESNISEKRMDAIIRLTDFDKIELDAEGKEIKDAETHKANIKKEWSDYIVTEQKTGAETPTPPSNNGKTVNAPSAAAQRAMAFRNNLYGTVKQEG